MIKYFWPLKSFLFFILLGCIVGICSFLAHFSYIPDSPSQIQFTVKTPIPVIFGIYYDSGEGFNQQDSQFKEINTTNEKAEVVFCLPVNSRLQGIRFDPSTEATHMTIYSISLHYNNGKEFKVPWDSLKAEQQILSHTWNETTFSFETTANADDPIFSLSIFNAPPNQSEKNKKLFHYGRWILAGFFLTFLGRFFILFFFLGR